MIPPGILSTLFVDDLSLSFSASTMALAECRIQLGINNVVKWADTNGFKFSYSKTAVVHFCKIRKFHLDPDLYLKNHRIPCVEETRFLGLIFDKKLTWVPHFKAIKTKCMKALEILRVLSHTTWGSDRKTLLRLHHSLILSKLSYGCEVFSSFTVNRLKILNSIHHAGVRLSTGAFKSSPIPSLLVDACELPLDLYLQSLLVRYWYRLQRLPDSLALKAVNNQRFFNFKNTVNLFIHIARIPIGDSPRVHPNILKCPLHSPVAKGYRLVVIASRAMVCKTPTCYLILESLAYARGCVILRSHILILLLLILLIFHHIHS